MNKTKCRSLCSPTHWLIPKLSSTQAWSHKEVIKQTEHLTRTLEQKGNERKERYVVHELGNGDHILECIFYKSYNDVPSLRWLLSVVRNFDGKGQEPASGRCIPHLLHWLYFGGDNLSDQYVTASEFAFFAHVHPLAAGMVGSSTKPGEVART